MSDPTLDDMRARLEEAESVIRKLLLCTTYESFQAMRRPAEKSMFSLREILDAQSKHVCDKLEQMRAPQ